MSENGLENQNFDKTRPTIGAEHWMTDAIEILIWNGILMFNKFCLYVKGCLIFEKRSPDLH